MDLHVAIQGEPVAVTCGRAVFWIVYRAGGFRLRLADGDSVTDPGDPLGQIRRALGGDIGEWCDEHGCTFRLSLRPWRECDASEYRVLTNFVTGTGPTLVSSWSTLSDLRKQLGGDEGVLRDPFGAEHAISLKPWADSDPASTRVQPVFVPHRRMGWWRRLLSRLEEQALADKAAREARRG